MPTQSGLCRISLVIPAYNEENYIGACLESALANSHGGFHEIIVIDNRSTDRTAEIARGFKGVKVVREEEKGLVRARARGLAEATGDLIAYIDADTQLPSGWIDIVNKTYGDGKSDIVCLSGPYRYYDGTFAVNFFERSLWSCAPMVSRIVGYMVLGGNFVAKKSALVAMGGFDKSIEFYGEDTDIARRLSKHGKVVWRSDFFMPTSSRRLASEGFLKTNLTYGLNFIWPVLFGKPFTKKYNDVRP